MILNWSTLKRHGHAVKKAASQSIDQAMEPSLRRTMACIADLNPQEADPHCRSERSANFRGLWT
jgi:hypothetical protein